MERDRSSSVSSSTTAATTPEVVPPDDTNDIWASDDEHDPAHTLDERQDDGSLLSDLPTIRRQHMTDGYREGLSIGKAKVMQKGFDEGYPIGVSIALRVGKILGCMEGILTAKDVPEETKAPIRRLLEQAKQELALSFLLKNVDDQTIVQSSQTPESVEKVLSKWEKYTFGDVSPGESSREVKIDDNR